MSVDVRILFLVLVFVPVINAAPPPNLTKDYYEKTCPGFSKIVRETVKPNKGMEAMIAAGTLRLFFHDCFLEGCDASVLLSTNSSEKAERDDDLNESLPVYAFDIVTSIKTMLELSCPGVVSCADILAQATRDLVTMVGGPSYEVKLGRKDGLESKAHKVKENLPLVEQSVSDMLSIFQKNGFTLKELVALSGGHTIGVSRCKKFIDRVLPKTEPGLDAQFAGVLKNLCQNDTINKIALLDPVTPSKFDNMYFKNLERGIGLLATDQILFKDNSTRPFVELYANNQTAFFEDFARAMEKLSTVGVKGEGDGEVRLKCDQINNPNV